MKKEKVQLKLVAVSGEMHERIRTLAFERRISLKDVVEEALKSHYGWGKEKE